MKKPKIINHKILIVEGYTKQEDVDRFLKHIDDMNNIDDELDKFMQSAHALLLSDIDIMTLLGITSIANISSASCDVIREWNAYFRRQKADIEYFKTLKIFSDIFIRKRIIRDTSLIEAIIERLDIKPFVLAVARFLKR